MNLIKHEIYKIFSQKVIYIAFVVFVALYSLYFFSTTNLSLQNEIKEIYHTMDGKTTEEKIDWANREYEEIKNRPTPGVKPDDKTSAIASVAIDIQNSVQLGNEEFYDLQGWKNIITFNNQIGFYFIGGLVILGLSNLFSHEYTTRMDSLIFSSKHGRRRMTIAKIAAVAVYCSVFVLLFSCIVLLLNGYFYGLSGWHAPLKTMYHFYSDTSFTGPIWVFYAMQQLYVIVGSILLGLLVVFISSFTKFPMIPAFIGGLVFLLPDVLHKISIGIPIVTELALQILKYNEFVKMERLGSPHFVTFDLMGIPMSYELYMFIIMIAVLIVSCLCIDYKVRKRQVI
jgi:ABC-type transport system involved in multi-copper enzyme maturation permease subunit